MPKIDSSIAKIGFDDQPSAMLFDSVTTSMQGSICHAHDPKLRFRDDTRLQMPARSQKKSSVEPSTGDVRDELIHVLLQQCKSRARELEAAKETLLRTRKDLIQEQARQMGETAGFEDTIDNLRKRYSTLETRFHQHGREQPIVDPGAVCICCTCCVVGGKRKRKRELSPDPVMRKRRRS
jgi:hypothetical protein